MKKFSAFTLAEVLITLGIIGVVVAMTMPNLKYNPKQITPSGKTENYYKFKCG